MATQIGRWTHHGSDDNSRSDSRRSSSRPSADRDSYAPRGRSFSSAPRGGGGYNRGAPSRSFSPRGGNRGGFGSFGKNEHEISRFINKAVITEESAGPSVPEHNFA